MLLQTAFDEYINFYQPIVSIEVKPETEICYGWYKKVLFIRFSGADKIYYIVDNEQNRKVLSDNNYIIQ